MVRRLHAAPGVYRSRASHEDDALVRLLCSQRSCRRLRSLPLSAEQSPPPLVAMAAAVLCPQKPQLAHLHQRPQWAGEHHGSQALLEASRGCFGVQLFIPRLLLWPPRIPRNWAAGWGLPYRVEPAYPPSQLRGIQAWRVPGANTAFGSQNGPQQI